MFTLQAGKQHAVASTGDVSHCINAGGMGRQDYETETLIAHSLRGEGFDASEDGTGRGTSIVSCYGLSTQQEPKWAENVSPTLTVPSKSGGGQPTAICFSAKDHGADAGEMAQTLRAGGHSGSHANAGVMPAIAYGAAVKTTGFQGDRVVGDGDVFPCLSKGGGNNGGGGGALAHISSAVRRLTVIECEALQGFPPNFTLVPTGKDAGRIAEDYLRFMASEDGAKLTTAETDALKAELGGKWMADGPRYRMLGNSMAVPVVSWLGRRIQMVEDLCSTAQAAA